MRRRVYLTGVVVGILLAPLPFAVADPPPLNELYLRIYLKINDAEQLEKQGDYRGALDDFKDCYTNLEKIHQQDPNWESALVIKRMADCQSTIIDLQAKVDAMGPATPPASPDTVQPGIASVPAADTGTDDASLTDVDSLRKRLQTVELKLQQTEASLSDSQAQVETYRDRLDTVNQELQALKNKSSVDDKVGRLLTENKALTDKLNAAEKQIDDFKTDPKSKLALVEAQLKNLQDQFDESQAANTTLQQTITTLQQRLDQAQADLVDANQKVNAAGPNSAEYTTIKRENEVMRAILQREIQEQSRRDEAKRLAQEEFDNLKLKSKVLQEQLDILGSPMTPPTTDEERALIDSLKVPGPDVEAAPGNNLSVAAADPNAPATDATTNAMASSTPPTSPGTDGTTPSTPAPTTPDPGTTTPPASDNSTSTPPVTIANNDTTPPSTDSSNAATNAPPADAGATNTTASTSAPTTPTTPDSSAATTPATTNVADNATPPAATPDASSTPPATPPPANTDPPTVTQIPPGTTTVTDTSITHGDANSQQPDPTQYSTKARLPDEMRDTAQQAADLFKNGRYDDAAAKYQEIIDKYPESLYAWSNLGVVRFQQGKLQEALKALQQAVKLSPTDAFSYSNLGIVYYQLNQYENAIDALNSAKALDPNDAKTRNYLGCACSQKGWQEVAEKEFRKAIELDPDFGDAHFNLALVYATEKPPLIELARQEYKKAIDLGITKDDRLEKLLNAGPQPQPQTPAAANP
jgi:tetratricopeptide (TPR) repeat protein